MKNNQLVTLYQVTKNSKSKRHKKILKMNLRIVKRN